MKNALFLTIDFPPMGGGMARHSCDVCAALKKIGLEPVVIAPYSGDTAEADKTGYRVHRLKGVRSGSIFDNYIASVAHFFFAALRYCIRYKPEVVIASTWSIAGVAAMLVKKATGVPYIVFAHGLDICAPRSSPKAGRLMKIVLNNASCVISNSVFTNKLVELSSVRARTAVISPIVDPERLLSAAGQGKEGRISEKKEILTVARLVKSKGQDLVIRSLPRIIEKFPDTVYRIVGSGPQEAALKSLAEGSGVSDHVVFAGEADEASLARCYRDCDVFVMTSRRIEERGEVEGFGIVFLEAGVFGKPVVGSRSGGIPDSVADGLTGLLVDPEKPEEISAAVLKLFSDPALARSMGEAGRKRVEREFSPADFARKIEEVIRKVRSR